MNEKLVVLHSNLRPPRLLRLRRIARRGCEYKRCGKRSVLIHGGYPLRNRTPAQRNLFCLGHRVVLVKAWRIPHEKFYELVSVFWLRVSFRPTNAIAVLLMTLSLALTMHAQNANPGSISPSSGSGSVQTFIATYTATNSAMDIQSLSIFIMNGVAPDSENEWAANECILNYAISSGVIQLVQDAGGAFLSNTAIAGTDQTVSNSQCTVLGTLSSANISGDSVTVTFYVTFTAAFRGAKQLYLSVENQKDDNDTSVPTQVGSYNVTSSVSPLFVFPSSVSGSEQTFTAIYSDTTNQIESAFLNLKSSGNNTNAANACKLRYDLGTTDIFLVNDAGTDYGSPITSGSATPLSNRQCTVYGVGTSAATFGNYLVVYFNVSFAARFDGEKEMTMGGVDETGTSSFSNRSVGTYTVTAPPSTPAPNFTLTNTAVTVAPVGVPAISTITLTPRGGFIGNVALTCTVISPAMTVHPPTCAIAAPTTISMPAETKATLVVNTTAASAAAFHNPLQQILVAAGSITVAALLLPMLPVRWRWKTLLSPLLLATIVGAAGCGAINSRVIAPIGIGATDPGTTAGNYLIAVTGTSGAITATTAVSVTVK